jgi:hypothetical protein
VEVARNEENLSCVACLSCSVKVRDGYVEAPDSISCFSCVRQFYPSSVDVQGEKCSMSRCALCLRSFTFSDVVRDACVFCGSCGSCGVMGAYSPLPHVSRRRDVILAPHTKLLSMVNLKLEI